jgi:two-component system, NtrC family, response regulator HydG
MGYVIEGWVHMSSEGKRMKVLVVDDDPGIRETLFDIMTDLGFNVVIAKDGYQAIEKMDNNGFDVALIDVRMPGISGVETFRKIKTTHPGFSAFLMTAYAPNDQVSAALKEGILGVIDKPFDVFKICKMIAEFGKRMTHLQPEH